jgi:hypothetical protein
MHTRHEDPSHTMEIRNTKPEAKRPQAGDPAPGGGRFLFVAPPISAKSIKARASDDRRSARRSDRALHKKHKSALIKKQTPSKVHASEVIVPPTVEAVQAMADAGSVDLAAAGWQTDEQAFAGISAKIAEYTAPSTPGLLPMDSGLPALTDEDRLIGGFPPADLIDWRALSDEILLNMNVNALDADEALARKKEMSRRRAAKSRAAAKA